jgi:hypothetical protein
MSKTRSGFGKYPGLGESLVKGRAMRFLLIPALIGMILFHASDRKSQKVLKETPGETQTVWDPLAFIGLLTMFVTLVVFLSFLFG